MRTKERKPMRSRVIPKAKVTVVGLDKELPKTMYEAGLKPCMPKGHACWCGATATAKVCGKFEYRQKLAAQARAAELSSAAVRAAAPGSAITNWYELDCPKCMAKANEPCTPECTRMDGKGPYISRRKDPTAPVEFAKSPASASPPPPPKPPPSVGKHVASQNVGETGFPKIEQVELLKSEPIQRLLDMLSYMRPDNSVAEAEYIKKFISNCYERVVVDKKGNRWVEINKADGTAPDIMFSSHTDTVHHKQGRQEVTVGDGRAWTETGSCLGADDTVGNWLMIEMIKANVPGLYAFHRGEEIGGVGSHWAASERKKKFADIKACIAFDRKGYHDIITHQGGMRTASDEFAKSLNTILGAKMSPSTGGTFTDSKNYIGIIGECTNVSVGYHAQHGRTEWTELSFALGLRGAVIDADWSKLEFKRQPGEVEQRATSYYGRGTVGFTGGYGGGYGLDGYDDHDWDRIGLERTVSPPPPVSPPAAPKSSASVSADLRSYMDARANAYAAYKRYDNIKNLRDMLSYSRMWPDTVAHFLVEKGVTMSDIDDWFNKAGKLMPGANLWDS